MKKIEFGFIQGRMTSPPSKKSYNAFPKKIGKKNFIMQKNMKWSILKNGFFYFLSSRSFFKIIRWYYFFIFYCPCKIGLRITFWKHRVIIFFKVFGIQSSDLPKKYTFSFYFKILFKTFQSNQNIHHLIHLFS